MIGGVEIFWIIENGKIKSSLCVHVGGVDLRVLLLLSFLLIWRETYTNPLHC